MKFIDILNESANDSIIEKFIEALPKYDLEYHSPMESKDALEWRGSIYPTITDKNKVVKVALDRTDIFGREGQVWVGDPSRPMINGYVIQAIVTDPTQRGRGYATDVLKRMIKAADEAGLKLKLEPIPMKDFIRKKDKQLTRPQLTKWYARHGFEKQSDANIMTRNPKSVSEGQHFDLMGYRFDVDKALELIKKKKLKPKETNIKGYAENTLGLKRDKPEARPQSFIAYIDHDYLKTIPEDRLKVAGIIAQFRTGDGKLWSIVMDGNHRLARNYMMGKDTMPMYYLNEKDSKSIMF